MRSHLGFMNYQSSIFENKHFPMGCYSSDCQECSFTDSAKRLYTSRDIFTYSMKNIVGMGGKINRFPVKTPLLYYYITDLYVSSDVSCGCVILGKELDEMPSDSDVGLFYVPDLEHTQHATMEREKEILGGMVHSVVCLLVGL